ncbi:hypothetical protein GGX14DRAFT_402788 [Mycena pura]|uniref:Uncharacterized protein n=1 Tax=Mycena pura TaxID=153505 RepID=A0AAD6UY17_9AGAR|nr:hypothetical protein GGX14DRAFT_402788 [Mycena pura]
MTWGAEPSLPHDAHLPVTRSPSESPSSRPAPQSYVPPHLRARQDDSARARHETLLSGSKPTTSAAPSEVPAGRSSPHFLTPTCRCLRPLVQRDQPLRATSGTYFHGSMPTTLVAPNEVLEICHRSQYPAAPAEPEGAANRQESSSPGALNESVAGKWEGSRVRPGPRSLQDSTLPLPVPPWPPPLSNSVSLWPIPPWPPPRIYLGRHLQRRCTGDVARSRPTSATGPRSSASPLACLDLSPPGVKRSACNQAPYYSLGRHLTAYEPWRAHKSAAARAWLATPALSKFVRPATYARIRLWRRPSSGRLTVTQGCVRGCMHAAPVRLGVLLRSIPILCAHLPCFSVHSPCWSPACALVRHPSIYCLCTRNHLIRRQSSQYARAMGVRKSRRSIAHTGIRMSAYRGAATFERPCVLVDRAVVERLLGLHSTPRPRVSNQRCRSRASARHGEARRASAEQWSEVRLLGLRFVPTVRLPVLSLTLPCLSRIARDTGVQNPGLAPMPRDHGTVERLPWLHSVLRLSRRHYCARESLHRRSAQRARGRSRGEERSEELHLGMLLIWPSPSPILAPLAEILKLTTRLCHHVCAPSCLPDFLVVLSRPRVVLEASRIGERLAGLHLILLSTECRYIKKILLSGDCEYIPYESECVRWLKWYSGGRETALQLKQARIDSSRIVHNAGRHARPRTGQYRSACTYSVDHLASSGARLYRRAHQSSSVMREELQNGERRLALLHFIPLLVVSPECRWAPTESRGLYHHQYYRLAWLKYCWCGSQIFKWHGSTNPWLVANSYHMANPQMHDNSSEWNCEYPRKNQRVQTQPGEIREARSSCLSDVLREHAPHGRHTAAAVKVEPKGRMAACWSSRRRMLRKANSGPPYCGCRESMAEERRVREEDETYCLICMSPTSFSSWPPHQHPGRARPLLTVACSSGYLPWGVVVSSWCRVRRQNRFLRAREIREYVARDYYVNCHFTLLPQRRRKCRLRCWQPARTCGRPQPACTFSYGAVQRLPNGCTRPSSESCTRSRAVSSTQPSAWKRQTRSGQHYSHCPARSGMPACSLWHPDASLCAHESALARVWLALSKFARPPTLDVKTRPTTDEPQCTYEHAPAHMRIAALAPSKGVQPPSAQACDRLWRRPLSGGPTNTRGGSRDCAHARASRVAFTTYASMPRSRAHRFVKRTQPFPVRVRIRLWRRPLSGCRTDTRGSSQCCTHVARIRQCASAPLRAVSSLHACRPTAPSRHHLTPYMCGDATAAVSVTVYEQRHHCSCSWHSAQTATLSSLGRPATSSGVLMRTCLLHPIPGPSMSLEWHPRRVRRHLRRRHGHDRRDATSFASSLYVLSVTRLARTPVLAYSRWRRSVSRCLQPGLPLVPSRRLASSPRVAQVARHADISASCAGVTDFIAIPQSSVSSGVPCVGVTSLSSAVASQRRYPNRRSGVRQLLSRALDVSLCAKVFNTLPCTGGPIRKSVMAKKRYGTLACVAPPDLWGDWLVHPAPFRLSILRVYRYPRRKLQLPRAHEPAPAQATPAPSKCAQPPSARARIRLRNPSSGCRRKAHGCSRCCTHTTRIRPHATLRSVSSQQARPPAVPFFQWSRPCLCKHLFAGRTFGSSPAGRQLSPYMRGDAAAVSGAASERRHYCSCSWHSSQAVLLPQLGPYAYTIKPSVGRLRIRTCLTQMPQSSVLSNVQCNEEMQLTRAVAFQRRYPYRRSGARLHFFRGLNVPLHAKVSNALPCTGGLIRKRATSGLLGDSSQAEHLPLGTYMYPVKPGVASLRVYCTTTRSSANDTVVKNPAPVVVPRRLELLRYDKRASKTAARGSKLLPSQLPRAQKLRLRIARSLFFPRYHGAKPLHLGDRERATDWGAPCRAEPHSKTSSVDPARSDCLSLANGTSCYWPRLSEPCRLLAGLPGNNARKPAERTCAAALNGLERSRGSGMGMWCVPRFVGRLALVKPTLLPPSTLQACRRSGCSPFRSARLSLRSSINSAGVPTPCVHQLKPHLHARPRADSVRLLRTLIRGASEPGGSPRYPTLSLVYHSIPTGIRTILARHGTCTLPHSSDRVRTRMGRGVVERLPRLHSASQIRSRPYRSQTAPRCKRAWRFGASARLRNEECLSDRHIVLLLAHIRLNSFFLHFDNSGPIRSASKKQIDGLQVVLSSDTHTHCAVSSCCMEMLQLLPTDKDSAISAAALHANVNCAATVALEHHPTMTLFFTKKSKVSSQSL